MTKYSSKVKVHTTYIQASNFRMAYAVLAGTWSDKNGRKPMLFLPVFCALLQSVSYGLNYWFMNEMVWQLLYLEMIIDIGGNFVLYYMMEYSYIVDITTEENRFRL